jgi:hypothetical protein
MKMACFPLLPSSMPPKQIRKATRVTRRRVSTRSEQQSDDDDTSATVDGLSTSPVLEGNAPDPSSRTLTLDMTPATQDPDSRIIPQQAPTTASTAVATVELGSSSDDDYEPFTSMTVWLRSLVSFTRFI